MHSITIDDLTIGQAKELAALFGNVRNTEVHSGLNSMIGQKVIVRTYSAGVHFGTLDQKAGREVILKDARRLWKWHAADGICIHGVARFGIIDDESKICAPITFLWLEAIEIVPCTDAAIKSIEGAKHATP